VSRAQHGRRPDPATLFAAVGIAAFLAITLGPSLLGLQVFAGLDLLRLFLPYSRAFPLEEPVASIFVRDTLDSLLPAYSEFRRRLFNGDLAFWSPWSAGGAPLAALPSYALFSPLSLPYWLLPTWLAPAVTQLLTILTGIAGTALFLRRLSCSAGAALVGGMVFVTSGYMVAWVNWPQTRVGAFIPLLFWALERFVQLRTARALVPIAVSVAGLVFGGFPAVTGLALYAGAAYLVVRLLAERSGRSWWQLIRDAAATGAAVLLGLALTAVQLLPFAGYLGTLDLSYREQQFFSTTPLKYAATAVFPQAFFANQYGPNSPFSREINPIEINMHLGSVAVLLAAIAVLRIGRLPRPRGATSFLLALSVVALWLIYIQGPLVDWLAAVPVFEGNPVGRIRSLLGFSVAALAGLGFDAVLRAARERGWRARLETVLVPAGLLALLAGGYLVDRAQTPLLGVQVRRDVVLACAAAVVAGGLVLAAVRWRPARLAAAIVVPLLVAGQGVAAVQNFWPTGERAEFYPETAALRFLTENMGEYRIAQTADVLFPSATGVYGINVVGGHSFTNSTWGELLTAIDPNTFVAPTITTLAPRQPDLASLPGLDRLAVRYYVSGDRFPIPGRTVASGPATGILLVENGDPVRLEVPAQALRGIGLPLAAAAAPFGPAGRITVRLTDADGDLIAGGSRPIPGTRAPSEVYVPLAAEDAGTRPGPLTVEIAVEGSSELSVPADGGTPRLLLVGPADDGLRLVEVADGVTIWERSGALPRIRWADRTEVITDQADRLAEVAQQQIPAGTVVLNDAGPDGDGRPAAIEVVEDSGDTVRLQVDAEGAGYVVVADAIQDGWAAELDGADVPIVAADHALGAVYVEAGEHDLVLSYEPPGRDVGVLVSAGALLVLMALLVPARLLRRRSTDPVGG